MRLWNTWLTARAKTIALFEELDWE